MAYLYQNTQGNCWDSERWKYVETTDGQPLRVRLKATHITRYTNGTSLSSNVDEGSVSGQDILLNEYIQGYISISICDSLCNINCADFNANNSMSELTDIRLIVENLAPSETLYFYELYRDENWTPAIFRAYYNNAASCSQTGVMLDKYTWVASQKSITGSGTFSAFGGRLSCGMDKMITNFKIVFCPNCCDCSNLITQKMI